MSQAVALLPKTQSILILMPDLPFLSTNFIQSLVNNINETEVLIVPSLSDDMMKRGTALLYMRRPDLIPFYFGETSNRRFIEEVKTKKLKFHVLESDLEAKDIDTLEDVQYLYKHLDDVASPNLYEQVLTNLFSENQVN